MNKKVFTILLILLSALLVLAACDNRVDQGKVIVEVNDFELHYWQGKFYIVDEETSGFDYGKLFVVTEGDDYVAVTADMLDTSALTATGGTVKCTYKGQSATAEIVIEHTEYGLALSVGQVTVSPEEASTYDYKSLFRATHNGETAEITDNMVTSDVAATEGDYTYTVNFHGVIRTLKVRVQDIYTIETSRSSVTIASKDLFNYDYAALFTVTKNGEPYDVTDADIDLSGIKRWGGEGKLVCNVGNYSKEIKFTVTHNVYLPSVRTTSLSINVARVDSYDFTKLFGLKIDGEDVAVTQDMLDGTVVAAAGKYTLSLSVDGMTVKVDVNVVEGEVMEGVACYPSLKLHINQVAEFDVTRLFSLYVDEKEVAVTAEMVDATQLLKATEAGNYTVTLVYGDKNVAQTVVIVTDEQPITVVARNESVETYTNSAPLDLTELFVVTDNGNEVTVTADMLTGTVSYTKAGSYPVTCTYEGVSATVTIVVKDGVVIVTRAEEIEVKSGTMVATYDFNKDIRVVVNGIVPDDVTRYLTFGDDNLTIAQLGYVPFPAEMSVTVTIKYCDKPVGVNINYTTYTKTINYRTVENTYKINLVSDVVSLDDPEGFNPLGNIKVYLNGQAVAKNLTFNKDWVDSMTLYAVARTEFDPDASWQTVTIDVYVNGVGSAPVTVSYDVEIKADLQVVAHDKTIFSGETIRTTDLFEIYADGRSVTVLPKYVSGKVDVFTAGRYAVVVNYGGVTKTAFVTVIDSRIVGEYESGTLTVEKESSEDSDGYVSQGSAARLYPQLVIYPDCSVKIGSSSGQISGSDDNGVMTVNIGIDNYTMFFDNGIVFLQPTNEMRMQFGTDTLNRPLMYARTDLYTIDGIVQINSSSKHVVLCQYEGPYTLEAMHVAPIGGGNAYWYGVKTKMKELASGGFSANNYFYEISHGVVEFSNGFYPDKNVQGTYEFLGETNSFLMSNGVVGKIVDPTAGKNPLKGTYKGKYNGSAATLVLGEKGQISFGFNSQTDKLVDITYSTDISGANAAEGTYLATRAEKMNSTNPKEKLYYSYKFALDMQAGTFTVLQRDNLFGYYRLGDTAIFLDGYGSGFITFNPNSYLVTKLTYRQSGNELFVDFVGATSTFPYAGTAQFYLSDFLNLLTVKQMPLVDVEKGADMSGKCFVNSEIVDGAVVDIDVGYIAGSGSDARKDFYDAINVVTANGSWTTEDKKKSSNIDVTSVSFTEPGVYRYAIKVKVGGKTVKGYYSVEVLDDIYAGNKFVGNYSNSFAGEQAALTLSNTGVARLVLSGTRYDGRFVPYDDRVVMCLTSQKDGSSLTVYGFKHLDKTLYLEVSGHGTVYVTAYEINQAGNGNVTLTRLAAGGSFAYFITVGNVTTRCDAPEDNILTIVSGGESKLLRVVDWNDSDGGLQEADGLQGSYVDVGGVEGNLEIDGFGGVNFGEQHGVYTVTRSGAILARFGDNRMAFMLKGEQYRIVTIPSAEELIADKTIGGTVSFYCGSSAYEANTTFVFGSDGVVTCVSVSPMHDDGDYACNGDIYECPFGNKDGFAGKYTLSDDSVTLTFVGSVEDEDRTFTFTFTFDDRLSPSSLICTSSSMTDRYTHGAVTVGCLFHFV